MRLPVEGGRPSHTCIGVFQELCVGDQNIWEILLEEPGVEPGASYEIGADSESNKSPENRSPARNNALRRTAMRDSEAPTETTHRTSRETRLGLALSPPTWLRNSQ